MVEIVVDKRAEENPLTLRRDKWYQQWPYFLSK
jgi:hypothetical protein